MSLLLSHRYPGSGVVLDLSIPDLCTLTYFHELCLTHVKTSNYLKENDIIHGWAVTNLADWRIIYTIIGIWLIKNQIFTHDNQSLLTCKLRVVHLHTT